METETDPNSAGSVSLATTGAGELERLRYVIRHAYAWTSFWTHYQDVNFRHRTLRNHMTTLTSYKELFRSEAHLAASSVRFHLMSVSIPGYYAGTAHPESAFLLFHVDTAVRFMVGIGGDVHVGSTLGFHVGGSARNPSLWATRFHATGVYFPAENHLAVTVGGDAPYRFHSAGFATHAVLFMHAGSGNWTAITAHATSSARTTYILPQTDGAAGQCLKTRGNGQLEWTAC